MKTSEPVNILIVDDLPERAAAIETSLGELGQHIVKAYSGREALRRLSKDDFAVILLDTDMPEISGFETAAFIRKRRRSAHTPIIFMTESPDDAQLAQGCALGAVDYVSTPIDPDVVRTKVRVFVDLHRQAEKIRQEAACQVAERAEARYKLVADASRELSRSLDFDTTLSSLRRTMVPNLADGCQVVLYDENRDMWFSHASDDESNKKKTSSSHSRIERVDPRLSQAVGEAVESGHAQPINPVIVQNAPALDSKQKWASAVVVPLVARDAPLGAIVCCAEHEQFEPADLAVIENLAGLAAIALKNAQLFQEKYDSDRRKEEFLAMLGHELRNPLAAITNAGELTRLLDPSEAMFAESLKIIWQQTALMKQLVDDLLNVSRITSGRVQLQKSQVDAGEIITQVAETIANDTLFTSREHTLHLEAPDDETLLEADPYRLEQILVNLLVNAVKYTDPGGEIWLSAKREGSDVVFRVRDTGTGIEPDLLPNVFDLFAQANRSLHRAEGGLGIGLTIVRGLTELHGGRVSVASKGRHRGTEFVVALPAEARETKRIAKPPAPIHEKTTQPRRVLVVEDQQALLRVTVALLEKLGHEVRSAVDGYEAELVALEYNPDVVLLDIGLPGKNGYEVAHSLREKMGDDTPMLVAMTGYSEHEVNRHVHKAKFDHHLVKPADMEVLKELLTQTK